jgi:hypothetical protein
MTQPTHLEVPDRRSAAADAYRASLAEGAPLSARRLGEAHGRSRSWGRQVIADVMAADRSNGGSHPAATEAVPADGRQPAAATWQRRVTALAVLLVAAVAATISYSHMRALAMTAGEGQWQATVLPLSIDGMLLAASMTALVRHRAGEPVGVLPWLALLLGVAASVAANIASAQPTIEGRLIAAWPPVALLASLEMLLRQQQTGPAAPTP